MKPRFGLSLPIVQQVPGHAAPWEARGGAAEILEVARAADRLGYDHLGCSDHVVVPRSRAAAMGETWYEPSATLGFVAGVTQTIELLTHVIVAAYRHPLVTAKAYATLDRLSGGRVILGIGSGHLKPESRVLGADFEGRGRTTDEAIVAIRAAWREHVATFEGEVVRFRDVIVSPRPVRPGGPRVWVGGNGRAALRRAARLGDGWIPWQVEVDEFGAAVARGEVIRREVGRTGEFDWVAPLSVAWDVDRASVADDIARWRRAGATGFHVGFASRAFEELLERMEWFVAEVVREVA